MITWPHPGARKLIRFADGDTRTDSNARVRQHLARCQRCRDEVAFVHTVTRAASAIDVPHATPELLDRIHASREAGTRIILPTDDTASPRVTRSTLAAGLAAAAIVSIILVKSGSDVDPVTTASAHISFLPAAASAQTGPPLRTAFAPLSDVDGTRLTAGDWLYELRLSRDGREISREQTRIHVSDVSSSARAAWRVESGFLGHEHDMQEDVLFDRATLQPFQRTAHNVGYSRFTVEQRITADSINGTMSTPARTRAIARSLPPAAAPALAGESSMFLLLRALVLREGLSGSFSMLGWGSVTADLYYPMALEVVRRENITMKPGAAAVDCWRVLLHTGKSTLTLWVRASDGVTVRGIEQGGIRSEMTLIKEKS